MILPRDTVNAGMLKPQGKGNRSPVWTVDELNRLLAVARQIEGDIGGIPARLWWSALLLTILDAAIPYRELLPTPRTAFHPGTADLSIGLLTYTLTPRAAAAIANICDPAESRLFPWPWDNSRKFHTLARRFEQIVKDAELPRGVRLFDALRIASVNAWTSSTPWICRIRSSPRTVARIARDFARGNIACLDSWQSLFRTTSFSFTTRRTSPSAWPIRLT